MLRIGSAANGMVYAGLALLLVHTFWSGLQAVPAILMFIIFWIGFYHAGLWAFVDRPAELKKKFPITSQELKQQRKAFYDWLSSKSTSVIRKRKRALSSK